MNTKILWIGLALVAIIVLVVIVSPYNFTQFNPLGSSTTPTTATSTWNDVSTTNNTTTSTDNAAVQPDPERLQVTVIGQSVNGNDITAYTYGTGDTELLLIGGIHGGYSWNTAQLAYALMDYVQGKEATLSNVRVTIIPLLNPDGYEEIFATTAPLSTRQIASVPSDTVPGRFNGNTVDLNRNFDCQWQTDGVWQSRTVSGGTRAFSEPESQAIRDFVATNRPAAVVAYYSAAGGVYASNCNTGVSEGTQALLADYSSGSGYERYDSYDFYATTGDMANWFAKEGIPAVSVLLTTHTDIELAKNQAGLDAVVQALNESTNEN